MANELKVYENNILSWSRTLKSAQPRWNKEQLAKFQRLAVESARNNPSLLSCEPQSILECLTSAAAAGLYIGGGLQEADLVPYGNKCTLIKRYKGEVKLARAADPDLKVIESGVVYEGDHFEWQEGRTPVLAHIPSGEDDPNKLTHAWALARYSDGACTQKVLTRSQIEKRRQNSKSGKSQSSPWHTWYAEMAAKTAVKGLMKLLPLSATYAAIDEFEDTGVVSAEVRTHLEREIPGGPKPAGNGEQTSGTAKVREAVSKIVEEFNGTIEDGGGDT